MAGTHKLQIHEIVEVGSDLWRSSGPPSLFKQGQLEQVVQHHFQLGAEYLDNWFQCLTALTVTNK